MNRTPLASPEAAPAIALVREAECIGCAKCLPVCPVDAIIGAPGMMHTVIAAECTGCEDCLAPCPVDCIEMRPAPEQIIDEAVLRHRRRRESYHQFRLANPDPRLWPHSCKESHQGSNKESSGDFDREAARREIAAAVVRVAARKKPT